MVFGMFKSKKEEPKAAGPQLVSYQTPFALSGEITIAGNNIYKSMAQDDHRQFRQMCDDLDGWVLRYDKDDVYCWSMAKAGEAMNLIKVFGTFDDISPELMNDLLHDPEYRVVWDESRLDSFRVAKLDDKTDIGYYALKMTKPVSHRDFLNQRGWINAGDGEYVIFNTSVPHDDCPPKSGFVRAVSKISGYLVRPWGNKGGCSITFVSQTEPKGWIPNSVTNGITTKLGPNTIGRLRAASSKYAEWVVKQGAKHDRDWVVEPTPWQAPQGNKVHDWVLHQHQSGVDHDAVVDSEQIDDESPPPEQAHEADN